MSSYSHLSFEERSGIQNLHFLDYNLTAIAKHLLRHPSTISRELKRNCLSHRGYSSIVAQERYRKNRQRLCLLEKDSTLNSFVRERLSEGWTPEQISGWLSR